MTSSLTRGLVVATLLTILVVLVSTVLCQEVTIKGYVHVNVTGFAAKIPT